MSKAYIPAALRRLIYERANHTCEYCLLPEIAALASHEVDHVIPEKHGGQTKEGNLVLACALCNKYKGSDLASVDPIDSAIVRLYQPRQDCWRDHFQLREGEIVSLSAIGRVTVHLLQMNRPERIEERRLLVQANALSVPGSE